MRFAYDWLSFAEMSLESKRYCGLYLLCVCDVLKNKFCKKIDEILFY